MSKHTTIALAAAIAGSAILTSGAAAEVLSPGGSVDLSGWLQPTGTTLYSATHDFTAIDVPMGASAATGVLEQTITSHVSGGLLFGLRISRFAADEGVEVTSVEMAGWKGFLVDTDFLFESGLSAPVLASRSAFNGGGNLTWSLFTDPMVDGSDSAWIQVATDAAGWTPERSRLTITFSDGSRAVVTVAAPSAVPAPGCAALLIAAAASARRRRR